MPRDIVENPSSIHQWYIIVESLDQIALHIYITMWYVFVIMNSYEYGINTVETRFKRPLFKRRRDLSARKRWDKRTFYSTVQYSI